MSLVGQRKFLLRLGRNAAKFQFDFQTFLEYRFQEPTSFIVINLKTCANNLKALISLNNFLVWHSKVFLPTKLHESTLKKKVLFVPIRVIRGQASYFVGNNLSSSWM